jgi:hypothetical protein
VSRASTHRAPTTPATLARTGAFGLIAAAAAALVVAAPVELQLRVQDDKGRPVEAVVVRVARSADPRHAVELYTDAGGRVRTNIAGIHKTLDIVVNPPPIPYDPSTRLCGGSGGEDGPTYETRRMCVVERSVYDGETLSISLAARLPTRQVCRLTGRGAPNGPYQFAGQDSAITIPWVRKRDGQEKTDVLWWFGDTTDVAGGEIFVPNKMAWTDGDADAANCLALEYVGPREHAPLGVDPSVENEATVWIDVPLVSPSVGETRRNGAYAFRPAAGDRLHIAYLSVKSTPPLFEILRLGLATLPVCEGDCTEAAQTAGLGLVREPSAVWHAPVEYSRAPEGSAFLFGDSYTILKVAERRSYCASPPYVHDCSAARPCADGSACVEPGRFCDQVPNIACRNDASCGAGRCMPGGVIAMQVNLSHVTERSAYRYWNAETRTFEPYVDREPDAILVDSRIGNSVSVMWSDFLSRWVLISNEEAPHYVGQSMVVLRTAPELLGPWSEPVRIMENLGGQRSYNPRFLPHYTRANALHLLYWTATYDAYEEGRPMHGKDFDYNVFLYETDLEKVAQTIRSRESMSAGSIKSSRPTDDH